MSEDEIFCAALELETEGKQRELVESLCANDPEKIERVWGLLDTYRRMQGSGNDSQSILDRPEVVFRAFSGDDELKPNKQVGNYVLRELLGDGATSFVYRAQQIKPVVREVALKILKPGMDSQRILARFGLEHQVIKRLEHPGITPVYDVGVQDNGRPFFAMELVPNPLSITKYAEHFGLGFSARVQLMIRTCEIVQHAHQRGVIHRDLKPSNILIEGRAQTNPKPRIIDFGIAKIMQPGEDSSSFTALGDRFGTPAYMSPEQAMMPASGLDIRSDVYSLGAILYELLTGVTPRKASTSSSIEPPWTSNAYWEYEIKAPSRVNKLHGKATYESAQELDWITLKAIAKDRQDRYQTVADLERDLQRFLNGEPVEAAGPSIVYRVKKLINRNRAMSIAATVTLLTIVITSITTTFYAFRAHDAQRQVQLQLQETLEAQKALLLERDRAEEAMRQSQSLLRVFQVQAVTHLSLTLFMNRVLEANESRPDFQIDLEVLTKPHDRLIVKGDWKWASSSFPAEIINTSFKMSSSEAAKAVLKAQNTEPQTSQQASQQQAPHHEQHPEQQPDSPEARQAALDRINSDRQSFQEILLAELKKMLPSNDPFIAEVLDNCGMQALDQSEFADAEAYLSEAVRIWEKSKRFPENHAQSKLFLAEVFLRQHQTDRAESLLREVMRSLDSLPEGSHRVALREFCSQLQTDLASARTSKSQTSWPAGMSQC